MMPCGMFVAAESFAGAVRDDLFTHFKREEDATMESGKLDEELRRLSRIADRIKPRSILLCNGSFASTNQWEGSEGESLPNGHRKDVCGQVLLEGTTSAPPPSGSGR
jgi:DNA mismatch repair ATPase MutS